MQERAKKVNRQIIGWINYYGHHRRSELYKLGQLLDSRLVYFLKRKYTNIKTRVQGWLELKRIKAKQSTLFAHWHGISLKRGAV